MLTGLLEQPADWASRRVTYLLYQDARAACRHLENSRDEEALHDFRVALRRLRSVLKAFGPQLRGGVTKKAKRRLRRLAQATQTARETEVQIAWLTAHAPVLATPHRPALRWLVKRLECRHRDSYGTLRKSVIPDFNRFDRAFGRRLPILKLDLQSATPIEAFGAAVGRLLRAQTKEARRQLRGVRALSDAEPAHRARLAVKRLRYVLEPLRSTQPRVAAEGGTFVDRLKLMLDGLGELQDLSVLGDEIALALGETDAVQGPVLEPAELQGADGGARRARRTDRQSGLLAIGDLARRHRSDLFARLRTEWLGAGADDLFTRIDAFADRLAHGPDHRPARRPIRLAIEERRGPRRALPPERSTVARSGSPGSAQPGA